MSEDKKTRIRKVLFKASGVLPDRKLGLEGIDTYCEFLDDLNVEITIKAIHDCINDCRFFPTISEIREKAKPYMDDLRRLKSIENEKKAIEDKVAQEKEKAIDSVAYTKKKIEYLEDKKIKGTATRGEIEQLEKLLYWKEKNSEDNK